MPIFRLIFVGHFSERDGGPKLVSIPHLDDTSAAGFYTTRIIDAKDCEEAAYLGADSIHEELSGKLGKDGASCSLEIESCEDITGEDYRGPRKGFTFFTEE